MRKCATACLLERCANFLPPGRHKSMPHKLVGRRLLPSERIAQHLSEWAQTAAGIHAQPAARFAEIRPCVYCRSCWFRSMILCKNFFIRVTLAFIVI